VPKPINLLNPYNTTIYKIILSLVRSVHYIMITAEWTWDSDRHKWHKAIKTVTL